MSKDYYYHKRHKNRHSEELMFFYIVIDSYNRWLITDGRRCYEKFFSTAQEAVQAACSVFKHNKNYHVVLNRQDGTYDIVSPHSYQTD
jgi:hypothetical protein